MAGRPTLVRRIRRKALGGHFDMRVYSNGRMRLRIDHPSNDPEIEFAMAGYMFKVARAVFAAHGLGEVTIGPVTWRDDP